MQHFRHKLYVYVKTVVHTSRVHLDLWVFPSATVRSLTDSQIDHRTPTQHNSIYTCSSRAYSRATHVLRLTATLNLDLSNGEITCELHCHTGLSLYLTDSPRCWLCVCMTKPISESGTISLQNLTSAVSWSGCASVC
jgi:hypothetical protein